MNLTWDIKWNVILTFCLVDDKIFYKDLFDIWDLHICELLFDEILVQCHLHNYVVHYSSSHLHFKWIFLFSLFHWEIISPGQSYSSQSARIGWLVPSVKECQFQFWNFKTRGKYFLFQREPRVGVCSSRALRRLSCQPPLRLWIRTFS